MLRLSLSDAESACVEGNIWQVLWAEAKAVSVRKQQSLFDYVKAAEQALAYLESLTPRDITVSFLPIILVSASEASSSSDTG